MPETEHPLNKGFTLVEISIVMIIIGLLIGGIFGGMKLVENMEVSRTVQDFNAIDSAVLTFKNTYGRLPGDISNPSTVLPNCTTAPCSTAGNNDRAIGGTYSAASVLAATDEEFVFWQHLLAANLISNVQPTTALEYGAGQPEAPIGDGYRLFGKYTGTFVNTYIDGRHPIIIQDNESAAIASVTQGVPCHLGMAIDRKMDDGMPATGKLIHYLYCWSSAAASAQYVLNAGTQVGLMVYVPKF